MKLIIRLLALGAGVAAPCSGQTDQELIEQYALDWKLEERARWVTYRTDLGPGVKADDFGFVSDNPLEHHGAIVDGAPGGLVNPFDVGSEGKKHVLVMVHGYGNFMGGIYRDLPAAFPTNQHSPPHETGATAFFDDTQSSHLNPGPEPVSLYTYLRETNAAYGFDPAKWVILASTHNLQPSTTGCGRSILENIERLTALIDLLWALEGENIETISFVSHSTGSPIVKGMLSVREPASRQPQYLVDHPWIAVVDDHINLAGAIGGTPCVHFDLGAVGRPISHQLSYGIQDPDDYVTSGTEEDASGCPHAEEIQYRFSPTRLLADRQSFKRTGRWPDHINVLSVAGVWRRPLTAASAPSFLLGGGPLNGDPLWPREDEGAGSVFSAFAEPIPPSIHGTDLTAIVYSLRTGALYSQEALRVLSPIYEAEGFTFPYGGALVEKDGELLFSQLGKSDGVVPNRSVIERVRYATLSMDSNNHPADWVEQIAPEDRYDFDWNAAWILPRLDDISGSGVFPSGYSDSSSPAYGIPTADNDRGNKVTYVEIEASHFGMTHNEHLLLAIKRRLGTRTVGQNVQPLAAVWVDLSGSPGGDGSQSSPFHRFADAYAAVEAGGTIWMLGGQSQETVFLSKPVNVRSAGSQATVHSD